ncbi:hypothetical protein [Salinimicrobium sp. WS361]
MKDKFSATNSRMISSEEAVHSIYSTKSISLVFPEEGSENVIKNSF